MLVETLQVSQLTLWEWHRPEQVAVVAVVVETILTEMITTLGINLVAQAVLVELLVVELVTAVLDQQAEAEAVPVVVTFILHKIPIMVFLAVAQVAQPKLKFM